MLKGKNGETHLPSQPKTPKPNKNEDHEKEWRNPFCPKSRKWLQEFKENLVDDRVPEHRDSHASSSHEPSLEPTPSRSVDLGKHSVHTHFPKDRHCEICQRTKITRARCRRRNGEAVPRAENFWWFDYSRSPKFSVKVVNLETIIDMQSWCKTWLLNGFSRIRAKQKLLRNHKEACKSFWSRMGSLKSFTLTIPWNLAKLVKIFPGIIVRRHHTDRKPMGLLKQQCAEWRKVRLQYCCNQVWMENDGQIPWKVFPICQTFKISCLKGKLHTKGVLENHLKDQSSRLVHWLNITLFLRKTSQESINLERKSYLDCSLDSLCTRGEFGRVTYWLQTLRSWKRWTHRNLLEKTQGKGRNISQIKWKIHFSSRRWTNHTVWRRSATENIHLDTGPTNSRRRSRRFSWRISRVFSTTWRLTSRCRWSDKWFLVHVRKLQIPPSRWTQSQTLLAERRILPYSTEIH